jgi:hypothetical protein
MGEKTNGGRKLKRQRQQGADAPRSPVLPDRSPARQSEILKSEI